MSSPNDIFASVDSEPSCSVVQTLEFPDRCQYVSTTEDCEETVQYINYLRILYCVLRPKGVWSLYICAIILSSLCIVIYIILGCTVDKIFCPALKVLSKYLGLNEHLAGVTLLAFGNGSPDIIGTFTNLENDDGSMLADLVGAGFYVVVFIGGLIIYMRPFQVQATNILRDSCFFLLGIILADYCMATDSAVTLTESILILLVYLIYLIVIFLDQYILKKSVKILQKLVQDKYYATEENLEKLDQLRAEAGIEIIDPTSRMSVNVEVTRKRSYNAVGGKNDKLFRQFIESLNPSTPEEWLISNRLEKVYIIIKSPVVFILILILPVVDYEEDRHGWSKLLNTIQIPVLPAIVFFLIFKNTTTYGIPVWNLTFLVSVPTAVYVFLTTRTDIPPNYHFIFCTYGMTGSILVIYICTGEAVEILDVLGIVTNSSASFLSCTFQAWGNSIVDLVSTVALARNGYPRMGYAACIGSPFFNCIISLSGVFIYRSLDPVLSQIKFLQGPLGENCMIFLLFGILSILVWSTALDFHANKSVAIFNFLLYALFLIYVLMGELEIIETFAPEDEEGLSEGEPR